MGFINLAEKTIHAKLVYYGVGMGGKTTSLQAVHAVLCPNNEVKLVSIKTDEDATLLFDFLPINLGLVEGFRIMIQGFTVPGQPKYKLMRKYVLQGADAVVLVVDSQTSRLEENMEALEGLHGNLRLNGLPVDTIPIVMQYNKRDLDDILAEDELDEHFLYREDICAFPSVAIENQGVFETFVHAAGLLVEAKVNLYGLGRGEVDARMVAEAARTRLWEIYDQMRGGEHAAGDILAVEVPEIAFADVPAEDAVEADESVASKKRKKGRKGNKKASKKTRKAKKKAAKKAAKKTKKADDKAKDIDEDRLDLRDVDLDFTPGEQPAKSEEPREFGGKREIQVDLDDVGDELDFDDDDDDDVGDEIFSDEDLDVDLNIDDVVEPDYGSRPDPEEDLGLLDKAVQSNLKLAAAFGELDQYKSALEKKNEELVKIAQNTVHDLNRPLSAIKLMLSSAAQGYLGDVNGTLAAGIDNALIAVRQMERLLVDLMDSSRLDFDGVEMKFQKVDMTLLVAEVVLTLKTQIQEKDVGVRVEPMPVVIADEWALSKTFMNLLGNAIQYAPNDKPPRIRVYHEATEDYHVLVVEDNGIGIPECNMDRLFNRFERGDNTAGISGTGLGLHIVKEVVQGHGGFLEVESIEGEGSRFAVFLPKQPVQAPHSRVSGPTGARPIASANS